jgi:hypothetical protein
MDFCGKNGTNQFTRFQENNKVARFCITFMQVAQFIKAFHKIIPFISGLFQIWPNLCVDDDQFGYITKI